MKSLSLSQPYLLVTVGIPGSGKTYFAEKFAATFRAPYVKYSSIMTVTNQNIARSDAFAGYMLRELFKTGHTIVFDGHAGTRAERTALKDLATASGYATLFIWVQTDEATAKHRYLKSGKTKRDRVSERQYDAIVKEFSPPNPKEHPHVVISGKHTYATQVKAVLKNLTASKRNDRIKQPIIDTQTPTSSKRNILIR